MDADLMDEKRKEHIAYEYLCHLEEAKKLVYINYMYMYIPPEGVFDIIALGALWNLESSCDYGGGMLVFVISTRGVDGLWYLVISSS